jgi:hypothetical protein
MKITFFETGVRIEIPEKTLENFINLGLLDEREGKYYPKRGQMYFVKKNNSDVELWIDDWRSAWKGTKMGAMGDRQACIQKMQEFMNTYPQYSKELIYQARDAYIASMQKEYTYLMQADYFIFKQDPSTKKVSRSKLASFCEDIQQGGAFSTYIENPFDEDI